MEPTTRPNPLRSVLSFILIGLILLVAVILGVRWAKGRSDQIAQGNKPATSQPASNNQGTNTQPAPAPAPTPKPSPQPAPAPAPTPPAPAPAPAPTVAATPKTVPSTGMDDLATGLGGLAILAYLGVCYIQSRRRLSSLS